MRRPADQQQALSFAASHREAMFSDCRKYRYMLAIFFPSFATAPSPRLCGFLMLNPSTADEISNDPTIERCERRAARMGFDGLVVTNLFAWRSTDPAELKRVADPIGPQNDAYITAAATRCDIVICAWGNPQYSTERAKAVRKLLEPHRFKLRVLDTGKTGEPSHPLYLSYDLEPKEI